ncbi:hypothetical protein ACQCN2_00225 [Brevibacillus ginsengisoli]|uniref:hypothetical protein n=1 Tax=Brevibacillus ginsengisoli TaxID=363854 RepID=UPI003CF4B296
MDWGHGFLLTSLRMNKLFKSRYDEFYLDAYFGPDELVIRVDQEEIKSPLEMQRDVEDLRNSLDEQGYSTSRRRFLDKQLSGMETMLKWFTNEPLAFEEEVETFFDVNLHWIPDSYFEHGLEIFERSLPGEGSLQERFTFWQKRNTQELSSDRLYSIIEGATAEARRRTNERYALPKGENVEIQTVRNKSFGAANWYKGNYHSLMVFNLDRPKNLFTLLPLICHEGYPGHHTESSLKEEFLIHKQGYMEQSVLITLSPKLILTEGIAEKAFEMIFTYEEAAEWMVEHVYSPLKIEYRDADLPLLLQAATRNSLDQISSNLVYLFHTGKSLEEIIRYGVTYTLIDESIIRETVELISRSRFYRNYLLSYAYGKRMVDEFIQKGDPHLQFYRLLTEQFTPEEVRES